MLMALLTSCVSMVAIAGAAETPSDGGAAPQQPRAAPQRSHPGGTSTSGTVTEPMDAREYTYVEGDVGNRRIWAVGPRTRVAVGDTVFLPPGILTADFFSSSLDRKFDRIYIVHSMRVEPGGHDGSD
jgi:hypothetical protein